jgi:plasmid replication initiation protein
MGEKWTDCGQKTDKTWVVLTKSGQLFFDVRLSLYIEPINHLFMEHNEFSDANKTRSVVKSNRIIEAKYRLNVREQKFILYMVSLIKTDDVDFKFYRVKISEFEKILNVEGKKWGSIYQTVKDIILNLNEKPLIIAKEDGKKQQIINWIASAEIEAGAGVIEFEFSEKLKPYLLQLKSHFTRYNLDNVLQLKSGFSIRMYELLKSHQFQGRVEYELEELKVLLGVDDKYVDYTDFKKRVLKTAQSELKDKSDLQFVFKEKRVNRKIHSIQFSISDNAEARRTKDAETDKATVNTTTEGGGEMQQVQEKLIVELSPIVVSKFGVSLKVFMALVEKHTEGAIQTAIHVTEKAILTGKVTNAAGFFVEALRNGFQDVEAQQRKSEAEKATAQKAKVEALKIAEQETETQRKQANQAHFDHQKAIFERLIEEDATFWTELEARIKTDFLLKDNYDFSKNVFENMQKPMLAGGLMSIATQLRKKAFSV